MTHDDVRAQFSDAADGELSPEAQRAFDAALEDDATLKREYERFRTVLATTRALKKAPAVPNLVPAVQERIRIRSGGKFFRDRFATSDPARVNVALILAVVMLLVIGVAWFGFTLVPAGE